MKETNEVLNNGIGTQFYEGVSKSKGNGLKGLLIGAAGIGVGLLGAYFYKKKKINNKVEADKEVVEAEYVDKNVDSNE